MLWSGWGDPGRHAPLSAELRALVEAALGMARRDTPAVPFDAVRLAPTRLRATVRTALCEAAGADHVLEDRRSRILHCAGKSTSDLLRIRGGDADLATDAVVRPGGHDDVLAVLRACARHRVAVVPFGGGTSVVGGLAPLRGECEASISLDLGRLDRLLEVDARSLVVTLEPGLSGRAADALLEPHRLMVGHFPQSYEHATLGGYAATRSSGQASAGYGRFDDLVEGLRVATPEGTLDLGRAPASAAGPDLRALFLGSEGILGVITRLRLRVWPLPAVRQDEAWVVPDFTAGVEALRVLAQSDGALPTVLRLSDETETAINAAAGGDAAPPGCLVVAAFEGGPAAVDRRRAAAAVILEAAGAAPLGPEPGAAWRRGRYDGPYLRDALLDAGALVETLETATSWSNLERLHGAVRDALAAALGADGASPLILCHVSHVYATGASLYFTVAAAQGEDPVGRWRRAKRAAGDAIVATGGTITHHHAVGVDHLPWMTAEIGALGVEVLRAVKARLDPAGILNPGKLLPEPVAAVPEGALP